MGRPPKELSQRKTFVERDADFRIVRSFEAAASAKDGDQCRVTEFFYRDSEREWTLKVERLGQWKERFEELRGQRSEP